jgi:lipopolysaccharide export system permease protein
MRLARPLDRYVFVEWMKIFCATAVGLPLLLVVIDLTDHLQSYLDRSLPRMDIALSYVYWMPQSLFMALPAAVLFATVF